MPLSQASSMPAISLCHAGLADRRDIVISCGHHRATTGNLDNGLNKWLDPLTGGARAAQPLPLSISEWQVTQIAAVAQSCLHANSLTFIAVCYLYAPRSAKDALLNLADCGEPLLAAVCFTHGHHLEPVPA
jgi:hypothetical protein